MPSTATTLTSTHLRSIATDAALTAGDYLASVFRAPMEVQHKTSAHDQVTVHDRVAEDIIRDVIAQQLPGSVVAGEEAGATVVGEAAAGGDDRSNIVWHVDPIDGTSNFAQGLAFFCTSIGVEVDGQIRAGVIYDPMADNIFSADETGAFLNGQPLVAPPALPLPAATLITGYPTAADLAIDGHTSMTRFQSWVETFSSVRRTGSGAMSIAHVAAGWTDASLGTGVNPWDVAAAMFILRQAGGTYVPINYAPSAEGDHYAPGYLALGPAADYPVLATAVQQLEQQRQS